MNQKERQKLCISCDGRIPLESTSCPYCAVEQAKAGHEAERFREQSLHDSLTSLYTPPYSAQKATSLHGLDDKKGQPFMKQADHFKDMSDKRFQSTAPLGVPSIPLQDPSEAEQNMDKSSFWPLLLLSIGANLLMLGLLQLFFSDNGFLKLEWDSSYWFAYCLIALPLLFLGFKKASTLK